MFCLLNLIMNYIMEGRGNAKTCDGALYPGQGVDFFVSTVPKFLRVAEVFVMDEATKTFSFVAFFVEGAFWDLVYMQGGTGDVKWNSEVVQ
jgi:hypothetical protein